MRMVIISGFKDAKSVLRKFVLRPSPVSPPQWQTSGDRNEVNMNSEKKILDVTCGSKTIWFNKNHPNAIYADKRTEHITNIWKSGNGVSERTCFVHPDVMCDFTDLPFDDNQFALVVFDPPHLINVGENSWMCKKYGKLDENWPKMLHDGFRECMRVLKPGRRTVC